MQKHYFLLEKLLLFLFYLESMLMLQGHHKQLFWLIAALVALLSFTFEGARPYTPLFVLIFIADLFGHTLLQTLFVVVLGFLMVYFKFYQIEIVGKGPYNAGYRTHKLQDLQMCLFYPSMADGSACSCIPNQRYNMALYDIFFVDPTQWRVIPFRIFKFMVSYLFKIKMPVLGDASLYTNYSDPEQKWKVVVFSHGLGSNMTNYSALCGWWASHGYLVVSVQHDHDLVRIQFGKQMIQEPDTLERLLYNGRNKDLLVRAQEFEKALDGVITGSIFKEVFKDQQKKIKVEQIFLAGHSYGGGTVLETMANLIMKNKSSPLIKGLICMDAWFFPLSSSTYSYLKNQNMLFLNSDSFFGVVPSIYQMQEKMGRLREGNSESLKAVMIKRTDHITISDFAFTFGNLMKLTKTIALQEHTVPVIELHEVVISLFMQGKKTNQIIQVANKQARKSGLLDLGMQVVEEWRYSKPNKKQ